MWYRLLALLLVPALALLVLGTRVVDEVSETADEARAAAEIATLAERVTVVDQYLSEEALAGTHVVEEPTEWSSFLSEQVRHTDRSLQHLQVQAEIAGDPRLGEIIDAIELGLLSRQDIRNGTVSPLQIVDRYGVYRAALLDQLITRTRAIGVAESGASLMSITAMIEARSAHLDLRIASDLALTYDTWAPGQHSAAVSSISIEDDRLQRAEEERFRRENFLTRSPVLESFREGVISDSAVPNVSPAILSRASDVWLITVNEEIVREAAAVAEEFRTAADVAEEERQETITLLLLTLGVALAIAGSVAYRLIQRVGLIAKRATSFADGTLLAGQHHRQVGGRDEIAALADVFDEMAHEVERQARYDELTELPNRKAILDTWALWAEDPTTQSVAVITIDLDGFKPINDRLGHHAGDKTLHEVGKRLEKIATKHQGLAGRLGGDEFLILLRSLSPEDDLRAVADDVLESLRAPMRIAGRKVGLNASIGIARHHLGATHDQLIMEADDALYVAKSMGSGHAIESTTELREQLVETSVERDRIMRGLDQEEFVPFFQPIWRSGIELVAFEALVRWPQANGSFLGPGSFLSTFEAEQKLGTFDLLMLKKVCQAIVEWRDAGLPPRHVSVNLSAQGIEHPAFLTDVENILTETGCSPDLLYVEVTETGLMLDIHENARSLHRLQELGISIAVDDFGTGYSSLAYLRELPVDTLKLDRMFIDGIDTNPISQSIVRSVIALTSELGMDLVCEGVERHEELEWLLSHNAPLLQGYLLGRPAPEAETAALMARYRSEQFREVVPDTPPISWVPEVLEP